MVGLNKKKTIKIKENLKKLPIWKLAILLGEIEKDYVERKQNLRENSISSQLKKKRCIRGMYRRELLRKLQDWEKGKEESIGYSDTLDLDLVQEKMIIEDER